MAVVRAIRARGITKWFGEVVALDGVDLDVAPGQIHGLVGPNGAGKTTLLGLMLGLAVADRGRLEILGTPVRRALDAPDGVAGFVDGPGLYPTLTARQNLAALVALWGRDAGIDDLLDQVGLTDVADDRVNGFSLGMHQRLGLAAALLAKPRLLVLDEPANGLDPAGIRVVHGVLTRLAAEGASVVLSSHRMDDVEALCSEVTILATGRVVFSGPLGKLAAENRELDYRLCTSDPPAARRLALDTAGIGVVHAATPQRHPDAGRPGAGARTRRPGGAARAGGHRGPRTGPRRVAARGRVPGAHRTAGRPPMSAIIAGEPGARTGPARTVSVPRGYRFELMKLFSQWRVRLLVLACWIAPGLFVAVVSRQNTLPVDTLFGRLMHATGWAAAVADGGMALAIVNLKTWAVQQLIGNNAAADLRISGNDVGQEGPTYSPDGSQLWLGQADGYRKFTVNPDGTLAAPTFVTVPADGAKRALVGEAVFTADGSTVYSAVNGQNRVVAINAATGAIQQSWPVGNAPRDLVRVGSKLYVSNEGGRAARPGDTTINSYNTPVPADPVTAATTTGTVSVIDLANPAATVQSIDVGLHPTALYAAKGAVFVTNTATNDVSVIDTKTNTVVQTIATRPWPEASVGYEPDAVTLTDDGHLLVTLGRANAVAVYRYTSPLEPVSYVGLLPTDYYPAEITTVGRDVLVSNTRGIDARRPTTSGGHGAHDTTSSLQRFRLPSDRDIRADTAKVFQQNGWYRGSVILSKGKGPATPLPVPLRLGDPSTIKHVFLIVKENRTYDQMFGDVARGDGDPALAEFGENVTPNQHAMTQQFGLYDNTYDIGTNSAEGHNWLMQADDPEYTESSAGEYIRSYDTEDDALGHQRSGFLWTGAQAAGNTVRDFDEFHQFLTKPAGATWQNLYCDTKNMAATGQDTAHPLV